MTSTHFASSMIPQGCTLEVECLDRLYLNGYIGPLATAGGLVAFMRKQLGKPGPVAGGAGAGDREVP